MNTHMDSIVAAPHQIVRLRHETRRRILTVTAREMLGPRMLRLALASPDLHDFVSAAPDDHIKLIFPSVDGGEPAMRDFTPRRFDRNSNTLIVDFALHDSGPATSWATTAQIGDTLQIGGPRGSSVVPDDFDWYALIGDDTALPAIGRRIEELRAGVPVASFVVTEPGSEQIIETKAAWTPQWIARHSAFGDAELLHAALAQFKFPTGDGFVWIAAEAAVARHMRTYVTDGRGHPRQWTKAAGYWKRGVVGAHEKIED